MSVIQKQTSRKSNRAISSAIKLQTHNPLIIGHRGASVHAPENTLAAFERAFAAGADGIELDVRLARDGVPVVIHDATLRRTGLRAGTVSRLTSGQLTKIDAGTWFNRTQPKLARSEYSEESIPTLEQVFEFCRSRPGLIYVELKSEKDEVPNDLAFVVTALIKRFKFQNRVVVVSFDLAAIAALKAFDGSIRTGALFGSSRMRGQIWRTDLILAAASECGADELLLNRLLARRRLLEKAGDRHLPVVVWTVDQPEWIQRARAANVHALITNDPARLLLNS